MVSIFGSGFIYQKYRSMRVCFTILLFISAAGGLMIHFLGYDYVGYMPLFVAIAKFGVSGSFVILYVSTVDVFPTMFATTALGMVNFAARLFTIADP